MAQQPQKRVAEACIWEFYILSHVATPGRRQQSMVRSLMNSPTSFKNHLTNYCSSVSHPFTTLHVFSYSVCDFIMLHCILFKKTLFTVIFRLGKYTYLPRKYLQNIA